MRRDGSDGLMRKENRVGLAGVERTKRLLVCLRRPPPTSKLAQASSPRRQSPRGKASASRLDLKAAAGNTIEREERGLRQES